MPNSAQPVALPVNLGKIPAELKRLHQWVVWRYVWVPKKGKWDKPPLNARADGPARSTDPRTWSSFTTAVARYQEGGLDGIGLDRCREPETGGIDAWAASLVERMQTYTELSPSGTGLRLFAKGTLPAGGRKRDKIEMYQDGRYLTITGCHLASTPSTIESRPLELAAFDAEANPLHMTQLDLMDQRACIDFHSIAGATNGNVDWMARLLFAKCHYLGLSDVHGASSPTEAASVGPESSPSASAVPSAEPFPVEVFPAPLAQLIREGAQALPCPPDFIGVPMLGVLGTAIGTSRALEIKPGWHEGPRIYAAVVADPGSKKSPALELAVKPLYGQQDRYREAYEEAKSTYDKQMAQHEIAMAAWKKALHAGDAAVEDKPAIPNEPVMTQLGTSDSTLEAMAEILERNPRGQMFVRDELTGWALAMDQYRGGRGADRQAWLSFWNGAPVLVNRKSRKHPLALQPTRVCRRLSAARRSRPSGR